MEFVPAAVGPETPPRPQHTIWLINEHSTNVEPFLGELKDTYQSQAEKASWIPTTQDDTCLDELQQRLRQHEEIEVVVGGGDGTVQLLIKTLFSRFKPKELEAMAKKLTISVIGLGYKKDASIMLHGDAHDDIDTILSSPAQTVRPLLIQRRIKLQDAAENRGELWGWEHTHAALSYAGMGASAKGARLANDPAAGFRHQNNERPQSWLHKLRYRVARRIADFRLAARSLSASVTTVEHGRVKDITVANGEQMAGDMNFPVKLSEAGFFVSATKRNPLSMGINVTDRLQGIGYSGVWVQGSYYFEVKEKTLAHIDGETVTLESGLYKVSESPITLQFRSADAIR